MPPRIRIRAVCFYCNEEMNAENLKTHTSRNHPGKPVKRKGDPASVLTFIQQPTITKVKPPDPSSSCKQSSIPVKKAPISTVKQEAKPSKVLRYCMNNV
jgi:hypothetical protein